jgi:hypothetical protein
MPSEKASRKDAKFAKSNLDLAKTSLCGLGAFA